MNRRALRMGGFTLLPVILTMSLVAAIAYLLNRDNGMTAAMVASQRDLDRARYAAEAGLQAVNAVVQTKNCGALGNYPNPGSAVTNGNLDGASYSASANPVTGNTTNLTSIGSYNGTTVTLTRSNIIAYRLTPKTFTLQPAAGPGLDAYLDESSQNSNRGTDGGIKTKPSEDVGLIQFDLSMFPAGSLPLSATLSLLPKNVGGSGPHAVSLHRVRSAWQESSVTWLLRQTGQAWSTPGGDVHQVAAATVANSVQNVWSEFDVSNLATAWMQGRYANNGMLLKTIPPTGDIEYYSSDEGTASRRPKLVITYLEPCGATGPSDPTGPTVVTLTPAADAFIYPHEVDGVGPQLIVGGDAQLKEWQSLIRFDTSGIPAGSTVSGAKLRLFLRNSSGTGTRMYEVYRVTSAWTEVSPLWPTAYAGTSLAQFDVPHGTTGVWHEWNIPPALIREWVDGVTPNYGLMVRYTESKNNMRTYWSSREGSNPPQLVITY